MNKETINIMDSMYQAPVFKKKKKAKPAPPPQKAFWKKPNFIVAASIVAVFAFAVIVHFSFGKKLDPSATSNSKNKGFSMNSRYFEDGKVKDITEIQQKNLEKIGIKADEKNPDSIFNKQIKAKNYQEQRKIMAISKYEAIRERADRKMREQSELRKKYETGTARQLKEAVTSLKDSDLLGIMRLERLLEEKLISKGADSQDLDSLVFAYTQLAKTYEKKQMQDKAKEAYLNAFKLMKTQAPPEQEPEWNDAIRTIEQIKAKSSR